MWDVAVIGGGMAGLNAAWHAAQQGLATAVLETEIGFGGQVATVNVLDGWPTREPVAGYALASAVADQLGRLGVELIHERVVSIRAESGGLSLHSAENLHRARRAVVASGARLRPLGLAGEEGWRGKGISSCADCDGPLYRNHDVVVVGAGDSAFQEALVLAGFCRSVTIVIRSAIRARRAYIEKAKGATNITLLWDSVVSEIQGRDSVAGVVARNVKSGATSEIPCTGLFPFIGVEANTAFLGADIKRDAQGFIIAGDAYRTSMPVIRAVGAVRSQFAGQLVNAAAEGAAAALSLAQELAS